MRLDVIHIEPTNDCQLSCSCCGDKKTRAVGSVGLADFHKIAVQVFDINPRAGVRLFLSGDPLLNPIIDRICELANQIGLKDTIIHTNGYALNESLSEKLIRSGLAKISFSLDSYHIKKDDKGKLVGWEALKKVKQFIKINEVYNHPIHITIQALVTNKDMAFSYKKLYHEHLTGFDHLLVKRPHSWDQRDSVYGASRIKDGMCKFLKNRAAIYWNGDAALCCADLNGRLILGNVLEGMELSRVVQLVSKIGEGMRNGKIPDEAPCKTCERYLN